MEETVVALKDLHAMSPSSESRRQVQKVAAKIEFGLNT